MALVEKKIDIVFSRNGESPCWTTRESTYDELYSDELLNDDYAPRMKEIRKNYYKRFKDGSSLYEIDKFDIFDLFPKESKDLKGFKMRLILEPLTSEDVEEGWFEEDGAP